MPKFFVSPEKVSGEKLVIDTEDVSHILRVLRMGVGDVIEVCDTAGYDYSARIDEAGDGAIICSVLNRRLSSSEPGVKVSLYQGIPKGTKMEYIIQKTTELGITDIIPCAMSRCVSRLDGREDKKIARWQKIAEAAAKQSGRGIIPKIHKAMSFDEAVADMKKHELYFAPYECEQKTGIKSLLVKKPADAAFMIGPEGGFDLREIETLTRENIPTATLGPRILRTETAGETVLAVMMYEWGEME